VPKHITECITILPTKPNQHQIKDNIDPHCSCIRLIWLKISFFSACAVVILQRGYGRIWQNLILRIYVLPPDLTLSAENYYKYNKKYFRYQLTPHSKSNLLTSQGIFRLEFFIDQLLS